jgi:Rieske Fe-S protein
MVAPKAKDPHEVNLAENGVPRRRFLARASSLAMTGGLITAYGTLGTIAARYLYPARPRRMGFVYVKDVASFAPGTSIPFVSPIGERIAITRTGETGESSDFLALSSTCPHLGCQVRWEAQHDRFFCPCHSATFARSGQATGGPPAESGQALPRYQVKVERGLLFLEVALEALPRAGQGA